MDMGYKIITNNRKYKSKFDKQLKRNFRVPINYNLNLNTYNIGKKYRKNILDLYYRNDDLFYNSFKLKKSELYIFGLQDSLNKSKYPQFDKNPIALSFSEKFAASAIIFARKEGEIYFLSKLKFHKAMPIDEKKEFQRVFDVFKIDSNQLYINFGNINDFSEVMLNLSVFLNNVYVKNKFHSYLSVFSFSDNLHSVKKTNYAKQVNSFSKDSDSKKKSIDLKSLDGNCNICNSDIASTYLNNPEFVSFAGVNKSICANCYAKILVLYFKQRIGEKFLNKSYLLHENNFNIIKSYIDLSERIGMIGRSHEIEFNDELIGFSKYFNLIPKNLRIKKISESRKSISEIVNIIDKETLGNDGLSNNFKKLLFASGLSESIGWNIRRQLINEALSFDLKKTHKHIRERINQIILSKYCKKDSVNIFNLVNEVNHLTLNNKGELNDGYIINLKKNSFNENMGWIIRDILIKKIENDELNDVSQVESNLNKLLHKNNFVVSKKLYYINGDSCYLTAIINDLELFGILQIFERYIMDFESFIIIKLPNNMLRLNVEFKISINDCNIFEILKELGFENMVIK